MDSVTVQGEMVPPEHSSLYWKSQGAIPDSVGLEPDAHPAVLPSHVAGDQKALRQPSLYFPTFCTLAFPILP